MQTFEGVHEKNDMLMKTQKVLYQEVLIQTQACLYLFQNRTDSQHGCIVFKNSDFIGKILRNETYVICNSSYSQKKCYKKQLGWDDEFMGVKGDNSFNGEKKICI